MTKTSYIKSRRVVEAYGELRTAVKEMKAECGDITDTYVSSDIYSQLRHMIKYHDDCKMIEMKYINKMIDVLSLDLGKKEELDLEIEKSLASMRQNLNRSLLNNRKHYYVPIYVATIHGARTYVTVKNTTREIENCHPSESTGLTYSQPDLWVPITPFHEIRVSYTEDNETDPFFSYEVSIDQTNDQINVTFEVKDGNRDLLYRELDWDYDVTVHVDQIKEWVQEHIDEFNCDNNNILE